MCACRQKKSFLIEDILKDTTKQKPYKNLSYEPTKPLHCRKETNVESVKEEDDKKHDIKLTKFSVSNVHDLSKYVVSEVHRENLMKFNVVSEVQHEMELSKVNLETRRNTFPLHPTAMKPSPWHFRKEPAGFLEPRQFSYYSDPMLNTNLLRSQLVANRFASHPLAMRQAYGFDRVSTNCCNWWGLGGRRKGGQVRFTAAQTGALERRFTASKYLSPDERRGLATTLRLSDRQVKTWFQNRRAKWRRTAPESADTGSPPTEDGSDDEVHNISDDA